MPHLRMPQDLTTNPRKNIQIGVPWRHQYTLDLELWYVIDVMHAHGPSDSETVYKPEGTTILIEFKIIQVSKSSATREVESEVANKNQCNVRLG